MNIQDEKIVKDMIQSLKKELIGAASDGYQNFEDIQTLLELQMDNLELLENNNTYLIYTLEDYGYNNNYNGNDIYETNENKLVKLIYNNYLKGKRILLKDLTNNSYYQINNIQQIQHIYIINCITNIYNINETQQEIHLLTLSFNEIQNKTYVIYYNCKLPNILHKLLTNQLELVDINTQQKLKILTEPIK